MVGMSHTIRDMYASHISLHTAVSNFNNKHLLIVYTILRLSVLRNKGVIPTTIQQY